MEEEELVGEEGFEMEALEDTKEEDMVDPKSGRIVNYVQERFSKAETAR